MANAAETTVMINPAKVALTAIRSMTWASLYIVVLLRQSGGGRARQPSHCCARAGSSLRDFNHLFRFSQR